MMTDYQLFLTENGLTEESMQESLRAVDAGGLSGECPYVRLGDSQIPEAGKGIFASEPIDIYFNLSPIFERDKWTLAGRYVNHSKAANTVAVRSEKGFDLVATKNITQGEEITSNYRQVKNAMEAAA